MNCFAVSSQSSPTNSQASRMRWKETYNAASSSSIGKNSDMIFLSQLLTLATSETCSIIFQTASNQVELFFFQLPSYLAKLLNLWPAGLRAWDPLLGRNLFRLGSFPLNVRVFLIAGSIAHQSFKLLGCGLWRYQLSKHLLIK